MVFFDIHYDVTNRRKFLGEYLITAEKMRERERERNA
jgi:hypothetical protein